MGQRQAKRALAADCRTDSPSQDAKKRKGRKERMKAKAAMEDQTLQLGKEKLDDKAAEDAPDADDAETALGSPFVWM